jgi:hypothetical protein
MYIYRPYYKNISYKNIDILLCSKEDEYVLP